MSRKLASLSLTGIQAVRGCCTGLSAHAGPLGSGEEPGSLSQPQGLRTCPAALVLDHMTWAGMPPSSPYPSLLSLWHLSLSICLTVFLSLTQSLSVSFSLSLSLILSLSHTHCLFLTIFLSHTHTNKHTHTLPLFQPTSLSLHTCFLTNSFSHTPSLSSYLTLSISLSHA